MDLNKLAEEFAFTAIAELSPSQLVYRKEYRKFCEDNVCGNYNGNYSCPPYCGTFEELKAKADQYEHVLVFQTVTKDVNALEPLIAAPLKKDHALRTLGIVKELKARGLAGDGMIMQSGPCTLCSPCRMRMGEECPFPEQRASCISAYCLDVTALAEAASMDISWNLDQISYFSLYLY